MQNRTTAHTPLQYARSASLCSLCSLVRLCARTVLPGYCRSDGRFDTDRPEECNNLSLRQVVNQHDMPNRRVLIPSFTFTFDLMVDIDDGILLER